MSPALARPLLHTAHLLTFAVLFATGLLLFSPELRAAVTGGYSLFLRDAHRWGGVAFVAFPALIIWRGGARRIFAPPERRTARSLWQGLHVAVTVLISAALTITGFVLWGRDRFPESFVDGSRAVHDWLTYAIAALLAIHLSDVGVAAVMTRLHAAMEESEA